MADDNRMDNEKRAYGERGGGHAERTASSAAHPESTYPGSHPNSPRSPYGDGDGSPDTHIGGTQPIPIKKGLFDGISVAQVIAASAAAATSMLLASRIGIAGSVIGAAVSSMVTVICSQLYRNALDASARKLKAKQMSHAYGQDVLRNCVSTVDPSTADEMVTDAPRIRIAPTKLQARAAAERSASKRKVAVVSTLIAIAAVAASAGIILLTTSGQGLGAKAPNVFGSSPTDSQPTSMTADDPIEAPAAQANPNTPDDRPAKPENDTGSDGTAGTDAEEGTGETTDGTPAEGGSSQQNESGTGSGEPDPGQPETNGEGADSTAPTPANKKPAAGTDEAAGSIKAANRIPMKGDRA